MTGVSTQREAMAENSAAADLEEWFTLDEAIAQLHLITGDQADRRRELDELEGAATDEGIPVVRLDGRNATDWSASLSAQFGPLTLRFEFSSSSTPGTAVAPESAPSAPSTNSDPAANPLETQLDRFRDLAAEHGGLLVVVDDLHRVPSEARDQLFAAVERIDGAVLVGGTDRSSAADLDRAFDRAQLDLAREPASVEPATVEASRTPGMAVSVSL